MGTDQRQNTAMKCLLLDATAVMFSAVIDREKSLQAASSFGIESLPFDAESGFGSWLQALESRAGA